MTTVRRSISAKPTPLTAEQRLARAQRVADRAVVAAEAASGAAAVADDKAEAAQDDADQALIDAANAQTEAEAAALLAVEASDDASEAQLSADGLGDGTRPFTALNINTLLVTDFLEATDGAAINDPAAIPSPVIEQQVRGALSGGSGVDLDTATGVIALDLTGALVEAALGYTPLDEAAVGTAGGAASLDGAGKVPAAQMPALAVTNVFVVNSQAAQLALSAQEGDVAVRTDQSKSWIHDGGTAGTMADWQELLSPSDAVISVNGQTGSVTLTTTNISEGSNLYFTNTRADTRADGRIAAAVGVSVQAYDADLTTWAGKTAPAGVVVGLTDVQTMTNKTLVAPAQTGTLGVEVVGGSRSSLWISGGGGAASSYGWRLDQDELTTGDLIFTALVAGTPLDSLRLQRASGFVQLSTGTYADNAAAVAGGLSAGTVYKTATGELRIVV